MTGEEVKALKNRLFKPISCMVLRKLAIRRLTEAIYLRWWALHKPESVLSVSQSEAEMLMVLDRVGLVSELLDMVRQEREALGVVIRQPDSTSVLEQDIDYSEEDKLHAQALSLWYAKHAAESWDVVLLRRSILCGRRFAEPEDLALQARGCLSGGVLTEDEATSLLSSVAAKYMSFEQFSEWRIPLLGHAAVLGTPYGVRHRHHETAAGAELVTLTFLPSGDTYALRAARPKLALDGFKVIDGKDDPAFPAEKWRRSVDDIVIQWISDGQEAPDSSQDEHGSADRERLALIRDRLADNELVKPISRHEDVPFTKVLKFPVSVMRPCQDCQEADAPVDGCSQCSTMVYVGTVDVWPGSVLDDLRGLSEQLAERYHWQPADATWFILTGEEPVTRPIRARTTCRSDAESTDAYVSMEIQAWVTSKTVEKLFRQIQRSYMTRDRRREPRTLAVFEHVTRAVGTEIREDDPRWHTLLADWNREHPEADEQFSEPRRLRQCYERAKDSILHRDRQGKQNTPEQDGQPGDATESYADGLPC